MPYKYFKIENSDKIHINQYNCDQHNSVREIIFQYSKNITNEIALLLSLNKK